MGPVMVPHLTPICITFRKGTNKVDGPYVVIAQCDAHSYR